MVLWQPFRQLIRLLAVCCSIVCGSVTQAADWQTTQYDMQAYDTAISKLYSDAKTKQLQDMAERIAYFSAAFLETPYELGALGEGPKGRFDQKPLYRTDAFDCLTFTSTVLALAKSHSLEEFQRHLAKIQYRDAKINYFKRNHFTSLDWNQVNQQNGYIKDITRKLNDQAGWPIYKTARAYINKRAWFQHKQLSALNLLPPTTKDNAQKLLNDLHNVGGELKNQYAEIDYIPLTQIFDRQKKPNFYVLSQIPNGAIIEIVCPNWNLEKKIGTNLNVSHVGFVIHTEQGIMFREASIINKKVIDIPLIDYLHEFINSSTIKGINMQQVLP